MAEIAVEQRSVDIRLYQKNGKGRKYTFLLSYFTYIMTTKMCIYSYAMTLQQGNNVSILIAEWLADEITKNERGVQAFDADFERVGLDAIMKKVV